MSLYPYPLPGQSPRYSSSASSASPVVAAASSKNELSSLSANELSHFLDLPTLIAMNKKIEKIVHGCGVVEAEARTPTVRLHEAPLQKPSATNKVVKDEDGIQIVRFHEIRTKT